MVDVSSSLQTRAPLTYRGAFLTPCEKQVSIWVSITLVKYGRSP